MLIEVDPLFYRLLTATQALPWALGQCYYSPASIEYCPDLNATRVVLSDGAGENAIEVYYQRRNVLNVVGGKYPHVPDANKLPLDRILCRIPLLTGENISDVEFSNVSVCAHGIVQVVVAKHDPKYYGWIPITF